MFDRVHSSFPNYIPYTTVIPCFLYICTFMQATFDIGLPNDLILIKILFASCILPLLEAKYTSHSNFQKGESNLLNNYVLIEIYYRVVPLCLIITFYETMIEVLVIIFFPDLGGNTRDNMLMLGQWAASIGVLWTLHVSSIVLFFPREDDQYLCGQTTIPYTLAIPIFFGFLLILIMEWFMISRFPLFGDFPAEPFFCLTGCMIYSFIFIPLEFIFRPPRPIDDTYKGVWNRRASYVIVLDLVLLSCIGYLIVFLYHASMEVLVTHKFTVIVSGFFADIGALFVFGVIVFHPRC